ncbi:glycine/D-amino acid oxidase-like deaminating enzyme [Rhizobium mesoamericanum]|nr:glycine/D-amino acid oxidase-like deaminating enzyme [Rhizobium mesoamericanum]
MAAAPNWKRADILLQQLLVTYPQLREVSQEFHVTRWQGNRPSTPEGLPVIDQSSGCSDIIYAFGHGHVGFASAPCTAQLVAALLGDRPSPTDIAPFRAARFRLRPAKAAQSLQAANLFHRRSFTR